jgi:hypothetical protein
MRRVAFAFCTSAALLIGTASPAATSVRVENRTFSSLNLKVDAWPERQSAKLAPVVRGQGGTVAFKPGAKVLAEPSEAHRHLISLAYLDQAGEGCRFRTVPVRHTPALVRIVPEAEAIGSFRCEASTGSTIGDFVFTVR